MLFSFIAINCGNFSAYTSLRGNEAIIEGLGVCSLFFCLDTKETKDQGSDPLG